MVGAPTTPRATPDGSSRSSCQNLTYWTKSTSRRAMRLSEEQHSSSTNSATTNHCTTIRKDSVDIIPVPQEKNNNNNNSLNRENNNIKHSPSATSPLSTTNSLLSYQQHTGTTTEDDPECLVTSSDLDLLAKLEEANREYESDAKSLNSLAGAASTASNAASSNCCGSSTTSSSHDSTGALAHSRRTSDTSQISLSGGDSAAQDCADGGDDGLYTVWRGIIDDRDHNWRKQNTQVRELVRRGIPKHFRQFIWQQLCGAYDAPEKKKYAQYMKVQSPCEKVIRRDIARTYPEHEFFKEKDGEGQECLFNVIKAYSLHDREVGYCQGMAFIVGLLLMEMPEEEAFAVTVKLMEDYRMRDMYKPTMIELKTYMYQLEQLIGEMYPDLALHFQSQSFQTSMYASSWFLTLFATVLPLNLVSRIMDVFLSEGMEIIFKVALAIISLGREELMSLDMEGMLKFFQGIHEHLGSPEALLKSAYSISYNTKKMKKFEKEYHVILAKKKDDMDLKLQNKQLRDRCNMLEEESRALAERLVRGQVRRAEEEETTFVVQRELDNMRQQHLETTHQLALANERIRSLSMMMEETHTSRQNSIEENSLKEEQLQQRDSMIACLQEELVKVRLREAENDVLIRDLRGKCSELEEDKKSLREVPPPNSIAHLQEELIAVKLREAEANLSLKDLTQKIGELKIQCQKHFNDQRQESLNNPVNDALSTPKKLLGNLWESKREENQKLEEELITTKIRELESLSEAKELRLKVMELETQVHVSTNQLRRQDDEMKMFREQLEAAEMRVREADGRVKAEQRKYVDLHSEMREALVKARIRDAENSQSFAELTQKICQLETKNEEIVTEEELRGSVDTSEVVRKLQERVADLQTEIFRLKSLNTKSNKGC